LANASNQNGYTPDGRSKPRTPKVVGLGLLSAASALAGGLAVAWWYRKTLIKLQNPIGIPDSQRAEAEDAEEQILERERAKPLM
jgi:hypothetical protein